MKAKSTIIITLMFSSLIMLEGCYSYNSITENENIEAKLKIDDNALIVLTDGSSIETEAYRHIEVTQPMEVVTGYGMQCRGTTNLRRFCDTMDVGLLDSLGMCTIDDEQFFVCWLKDGTFVRFKDEDYLYISKNAEKGLWCVGKLDVNGRKSIVKRIIRTDEMKEISIKEFSIVKTSLLFITGIPAVLMTLFFMLWTGPG